jgi:citrate lyase subunit beta/citryl-CoA lyase
MFVPAISERMLKRAAASDADALILDLEDAVPDHRKAAGRAGAAASLPSLADPSRQTFARVNAVATGLTRDDLLAVVGRHLHGVVVPKVESPQDLRDLDVLLREAEMANGVRPGDVATLPIIESARGLLRCEAIATASDRIIGIAVGGEDYSNDIGVARDATGAGLQYIRATIVQVAAAYGLMPIDAPYTDFADERGLLTDARAAKAIGLKGKLVIHPDQVGPVNRLFAPGKEEIAHARRVVEAYERGLAGGAGAVQLDGRMIDAPIAERARGVIAMADSTRVRRSSGA